jgi:hypothetical protein
LLSVIILRGCKRCSNLEICAYCLLLDSVEPYKLSRCCIVSMYSNVYERP